MKIGWTVVVKDYIVISNAKNGNAPLFVAIKKWRRHWNLYAYGNEVCSRASLLEIKQEAMYIFKNMKGEANAQQK